jgi:hypothetical protein
MSVSDSTQVTQRDIDELLSDLPPESLAVLKQFVEFLRQQAQRGQPVVAGTPESHLYAYPTIAAPASSLKGWADLLSEGHSGDALADSETLYDKV